MKRLIFCVLLVAISATVYAKGVEKDDMDFRGTVTLGVASVDTLTVNTALNLPAGTGYMEIPLAGLVVDGSGNDVDDGSAPDITSCDNIPCIVWADSGETVAVQHTFRLPSDFSANMTVYALISSNGASGSGQILDWAIWENITDTTFDAAAMAQAGVEATSATLNASNEVLTLEADATAESAFTAGRWYTIEFFNASTDDDDLELKGLSLVYDKVL